MALILSENGKRNFSHLLGDNRDNRKTGVNVVALVNRY